MNMFRGHNGTFVNLGQMYSKIRIIVCNLVHLPLTLIYGVSVGQSSEEAPFTFEIVGSILATDSYEKSLSTLYLKLWVFSVCSGFIPQLGKLAGWVRINTVKKVISQLL
jgi:hypothetical protein